MENTIHFYLDEWGETITKSEFDENVKGGWNTAYVLYVGGGFVPLSVAVLTFGDDVDSCFSAFEAWARGNDRLDEIGEENPEDEFFGEYESFVKEYKL